MKWVVSFILSLSLNLSLGVALAVSTYEGIKLKDKNEVLNEKYWDFEQEKIEVSEIYDWFRKQIKEHGKTLVAMGGVAGGAMMMGAI